MGCGRRLKDVMLDLALGSGDTLYCKHIFQDCEWNGLALPLLVFVTPVQSSIPIRRKPHRQILLMNDFTALIGGIKGRTVLPCTENSTDKLCLICFFAVSLIAN